MTATAKSTRSLRQNRIKSRKPRTDSISNRKNNNIMPSTRPISSSSSNSHNNINNISSSRHPSNSHTHHISKYSSNSGDRNRSSSYRLRLLDSNVPAARILF